MFTLGGPACHESDRQVDGASEGDRWNFPFGRKFENAKQFLREVKTELKKVTWPSRKDTLSGTAIVLVAVFIIATFLGSSIQACLVLSKMYCKRQRVKDWGLRESGMSSLFIPKDIG